ncbi:MAG: hypothetical protein SGI96_07920 [Bacteroidota bacterium]|nr:hypothetical protein [Bacteroidota bacterium]
MLLNLLFGVILLGTENKADSLKDFQKQLANNIERFLPLPPETSSGDTCFYYSELLKVQIDKFAKVIAIDLSDSSPEWLKKNITEMNQKKRINYFKLDSIASKSGLRNCMLIFPLIIESDDFPCGEGRKKRSFNDNYFHFEGKSLKGNIIFGEQIRVVYTTRYLRKFKERN